MNDCCKNDGCTNKGDECDCASAFSQESLLAPGDIKKKKIRNLKLQILIGAIIFVVAFVLDHWSSVPKYVFMGLYMAAYLVLGFSVLKRAATNLIRGKVFDENFLMSIATIGALCISQWSEAVAVMLFYQVGEYFQTTAIDRSRRSIENLAQIRPDYANIPSGETLQKVNPETIKVGDIIVVKPGERVPLDGIVKSGRSTLDTSALTGESVFRDVDAGDTILSGCINNEGVLTIEVTATYGESTVSKIIEMVSGAGSRKSQRENLITRFAAVYTPVVVVAAVLLAIIPPLVFGEEFSVWVYRALSFLVISCPCALVVSVPLGYFGGIGAASKRGILVKGSNYLDALGEADSIIFDKTGTLTKGSFSVSKVVPALSDEGALSVTKEAKVSESALIEMAAIAEAYSDHPIAVSVRSAAQQRGICPASISPDAYREMAGRGVSVTAQGREILVGNKKLMTESGITGVPEIETAGTLLFVASDRKFAGYIEIEDEIKPEAAGAIKELQNLHIAHIGLLTGDHASSAQKTAGVLGITDVYSELLPSQKLEKMEEILTHRKSVMSKSSAQKKGTLVYVGDGINDAPVLVRADIGIAIGAMASGAAIEAADIVIMSDDLTALGKAIRIARKTKRIVMENIIFALSVKGLILILAALGLTNLWFAIFADVGVAIIAILNSVRAGR